MNRIFKACVILSAAMPVWAQQAELRLNPELGVETAVSHIADLSAYPFIDASRNHVIMNDADWTHLRARFSGADTACVRILHIGDSHIQAEGSTSRVRYHLQQLYGGAGRGLIAPLRLAGTNAPSDYVIRSNTPMKSSRLLKMPRAIETGFSGVSVAPATGSEYDISVSCGDSFDCIRIYTTGAASPELLSVSPDVSAAYLSPAPGVADVLLTQPETTLTLHLKGAAPLTAIELLRGDSGVEYSAIGNNGATYSSYNALPEFASAAARLNPDLIIVSLGTNEAFGRVSSDDMRMHIHTLVSDLRRHNPHASILLTTPQECYRRTYTRRKGRRRRTRTYTVNPNIERIRTAIMEYGASENIPVYDWYAISGGGGTASKWVSSRLMNTDRIHLTWDGYHLMGDMFADALVREILSQSQSDSNDSSESD